MSTAIQRTSRNGILAGGNWLIDHVKLIDVWPAQDALATIETQSNSNGGGPYNLLKDLAKMKCCFPLAGVGLVGHDADAEKILQDCDAHGINRASIQQTFSSPTSYTDVMSDTRTGRRTFFHLHGANALLDLGHFNLAATSARIFYLGYMCILKRLDVVQENSRTIASYLFEEAQALGLTTVADLVSNEASDFAAIINPSLPHLDYLLLNDYELGRLVGGGLHHRPAQLEAQARTLLTRGVRQGVIVHSPEIALCVQPGRPVIVQASVNMPQEKIAGTLGAGDAFAAGFLFGLHQDWIIQRSLELGVCVAAASLRDASSSISVEPWEICLKLGQQFGFRSLPAN